ncbi:probable ubiquitin-conjugating enzyme E2 18, partial [Tanacetum coccineum]
CLIQPKLATGADILYDSWSPAMTVSSVCISILSMLSSSPAKQRPADDERYVKNCRNGRSPKETRWWFHDDKVKQKKAHSVNNGKNEGIRAEVYDSHGESLNEGEETEEGVFGNTNCCNNTDQTPNVTVPVNNTIDNDDSISVESSDESIGNKDEVIENSNKDEGTVNSKDKGIQNQSNTYASMVQRGYASEQKTALYCP